MVMYGPAILARSLSVPAPMGASGAKYQYHSRGDRHSKIACWRIVFDLLTHSNVLARHAREGRIGFGINHEMRDFENDRKKCLDLVLCTPAADASEESGDSKRRLLAGFLTCLDESQQGRRGPISEPQSAPLAIAVRHRSSSLGIAQVFCTRAYRRGPTIRSGTPSVVAQLGSVLQWGGRVVERSWDCARRRGEKEEKMLD